MVALHFFRLSDGYRFIRNWRALDVDAFAADLLRSNLVSVPPDDVTEAFAIML